MTPGDIENFHYQVFAEKGYTDEQLLPFVERDGRFLYSEILLKCR